MAMTPVPGGRRGMAEDMLVLLREHGLHPDAGFMTLIERYAAGEAPLGELTSALDRLFNRGPEGPQPPRTAAG